VKRLASTILGMLLLGCQHATPPSPEAGRATLTIANDTDSPTTVFVAFGGDSIVRSFPGCARAEHHIIPIVEANPPNCSFPLEAHGSHILPLAGRYLNATFSFGGPVTCDVTKAEVNLNNPRWYDILDVSLVDGFSQPVQITADGVLLGPAKASGNEKTLGVYPMGCDICVARKMPPCGMSPGKDGCKSGTQYKPDVPCQWQGTRKGGGTKTRVALEP